jgi:hypothetical protein
MCVCLFVVVSVGQERIRDRDGVRQKVRVATITLRSVNETTRSSHMITTKNGVFTPVLSQAKKYDQTGNTISKPEAEKLVKRMSDALVNEYEGSDSSKGLAADRNALARTAKAIFKNADKGSWAITDAGKDVFYAAFGKKLDGKSGSIASLVDQIRSDVKSNSTGYTYWG